MNASVMQWQTTLAGIGTYAGKIDGAFGPATLRASMEALAKSDSAPEPDKTAMATPQWGDVPVSAPTLKKAGRDVHTIIVHCTATREGQDFTVSDVRAWHRQRGWNDIGYHYVVYRDGSIHEGRPVSQVGAHVANHNEGTIGVAYIGGVSADGKTAKDTRTAEQRVSLRWLVSELARLHGADRIAGHREYASKACPSFDVRADELGNIPGFERGKRI